MELTEWEKRKVVAEVVRLGVEISSFGGRSYRTRERGKEGKRAFRVRNYLCSS